EKIQPVLVEVGLPLGFVPENMRAHRLYRSNGNSGSQEFSLLHQSRHNPAVNRTSRIKPRSAGDLHVVADASRWSLPTSRKILQNQTGKSSIM
ncbi:MAG: hypothetical protein ABTR27_04855, partial [Candidatus Competibacter phosphatis]